MASAFIRFSVHVAKSSVLVPIGIGRSSGEIMERRASRMSVSVPGKILIRFFILLGGTRSRRERLNVELLGRSLLDDETRDELTTVLSPLRVRRDEVRMSKEHESRVIDYFNYRLY